MTPRTSQCEVFWALLSNSKHCLLLVSLISMGNHLPSISITIATPLLQALWSPYFYYLWGDITLYCTRHPSSSLTFLHFFLWVTSTCLYKKFPSLFVFILLWWVVAKKICASINNKVMLELGVASKFVNQWFCKSTTKGSMEIFTFMVLDRRSLDLEMERKRKGG
jgi:hypothetical protein